MIDMVSHAKAFASPDGGDNAGMVRALALGRLHSTRRRIAGALVDSGQEERARALLAFAAGAGSAWRPETGLALLAHRRQAHELAALQLAAAYAGTGGSGGFEGRIDAPQWLYLDGWLTPVDGRCVLTSDGWAIRIESDLESVTYLASHGNHWVPEGAPKGPWTAYATGGLAPRYVTVSGLRHSVEGFPWISGTPPLAAMERPGNADSRISTIHQGWRVILDRTPVYGSWVAGTATGCLLLDSDRGHVTQSGSSDEYPGLIAIEPPDCPVFCGEILVHECSHQHLQIYSMVAPLVAAGSGETYYSPIKRARRSIDRVLCGAHAVGNMIIYYATLRRSMELDQASQMRFDRHRSWFAEDYRPALDRSESLTQAGRALWDNLCHSVEHALEQ
jgi:HEXXH motif-containing protein